MNYIVIVIMIVIKAVHHLADHTDGKDVLHSNMDVVIVIVIVIVTVIGPITLLLLLLPVMSARRMAAGAGGRPSS